MSLTHGLYGPADGEIRMNDFESVHLQVSSAFLLANFVGYARLYLKENWKPQHSHESLLSFKG